MFPAKYQGAMFIARHGPWNRTKKYNDVYGRLARRQGRREGRAVHDRLRREQQPTSAGRSTSMVMKDGSLLVSDDHAGAIYRISYGK